MICNDKLISYLFLNLILDFLEMIHLQLCDLNRKKVVCHFEKIVAEMILQSCQPLSNDSNGTEFHSVEFI